MKLEILPSIKQRHQSQDTTYSTDVNFEDYHKPRFVAEARRHVHPKRHVAVCCAIICLLIGCSLAFGRGPLVDLLSLHSTPPDLLGHSSIKGGLAAHDYPILKLPSRQLMELVVNITRISEDISNSIHNNIVQDEAMFSFVQRLVRAPNIQHLKGKMMRAILSQQPFRFSFLNIEGAFAKDEALFGFPKLFESFLKPVFWAARVDVKIRLHRQDTKPLEAYPEMVCTVANSDIHSDVVVWQMGYPILHDKTKKLENNIFLSEMAMRYTLQMPRQPSPLLISLPSDGFDLSNEFDAVPDSDDADKQSLKDIYDHFGLHYIDAHASMTYHSQSQLSFKDLFNNRYDGPKKLLLTKYGEQVLASALALFYNKIFLTATEEIVQVILETDNTNSIKLSEVLAERIHEYDGLSPLPKPIICEHQHFCARPATCLRVYVTDSGGPHDIIERVKNSKEAIVDTEVSEGKWAKQDADVNSIPTLVGSAQSGSLTINLKVSRTGYLGVCSPIKQEDDDDIGAILGRANFLLDKKPIHMIMPTLSETCVIFQEEISEGDHVLNIIPISKRTISISHLLVP